MPEPAAGVVNDNADRSRLMEIALHHDLSRWREQLARSIARNNPGLRSDQIASAVNKILLSLLLLRFSEDRDLAPAGTLAGLAKISLPELLRILTPYAEGLYANESAEVLTPPDLLHEGILETRVVQGILDHLVSPGRLYDGSQMSSEAISLTLALFLTRTVRRSALDRVTVVDTDDAILAGRYEVPPLVLTGYQVRQAFRAVEANRSRRDPLPITILDPACGSGTLLLIAFRHLVDDEGGSHLFWDERREILSGSIFGLDSNRHAVAATRFILLLGCFENLPAADPFAAAPSFFPDMVLSVLRDLQYTIRQGNALIDPSITEEESFIFCPSRLRGSLNPFVFREQFKEIISCGGFDAIICNPPDGPLGQEAWMHHYFQRRYTVYHPKADRSSYFIEKALTLARPGGIVSSVMSGRWLRGLAGAPLRDLIRLRGIVAITDLSELPEDSPGAGLSLICISAAPPASSFLAVSAKAGFLDNPDAFVKTYSFPVTRNQLDEGGWIFRDNRQEEILRKIRNNSTPLGELVMDQVHPGVAIPENDPFVVDEDMAKEWMRTDPTSIPLIRKVIQSREIHRFCVKASVYFLHIPSGWTASHKSAALEPWRWMKRKHPSLARYLMPFREQLKLRAGPRALWWERDFDPFWQEPRKKILFPAVSGKPLFFFDSGRTLGNEDTLSIPSSSLYLCGILNSNLMKFALGHISPRGPSGQQYSWTQIRRLPIRTPDFDSPEDAARHNEMERLVGRMLELKKRCYSCTGCDKQETFRRKVRATDAKINTLVYAIYGLTAGEIGVVEEAIKDYSPT